MIKRKDITTRFDGSKRKINYDDWCSLNVVSDVQGGEFTAVSSNELVRFKVELNLCAETFISEADKEAYRLVDERLRSKLMHYLYRELIDDIHDVKMSIEFEGREKSLESVNKLMDKISKEMTG